MLPHRRMEVLARWKCCSCLGWLDAWQYTQASPAAVYDLSRRQHDLSRRQLVNADADQHTARSAGVESAIVTRQMFSRWGGNQAKQFNVLQQNHKAVSISSVSKGLSR